MCSGQRKLRLSVGPYGCFRIAEDYVRAQFRCLVSTVRHRPVARRRWGCEGLSEGLTRKNTRRRGDVMQARVDHYRSRFVGTKFMYHVAQDQYLQACALSLSQPNNRAVHFERNNSTIILIRSCRNCLLIDVAAGAECYQRHFKRSTYI